MENSRGMELGRRVILNNSGRELLTANRTYFVRTDGNDSNNGLSNTSGGAFATIQKAINIAASLDLGVFNVTISVANGTYSERITLNSLVGSGTVTLLGNTTTPSSCSIVSNTAPISGLDAVITGRATGSRYVIEGFSLSHVSTSTVRGILNNAIGSTIDIRNIVFGSGLSNNILSFGGFINIIGNLTIASAPSSTFATAVNAGARIDASIPGTVIALSGNPNFAGAFVSAFTHGIIYFAASNISFSGSATGTRYIAGSYAIVDSGTGGNTNYFPGSGAGSVNNAIYS